MRLIAPLVFFSLAALFISFAGEPSAKEKAEFVGSQACEDCHEEEYTRFTEHSKKATSGHSVEIMAKDLTQSELEGCYECHVTGYGASGGFKSFSETPELAHAGCEVCHGPGSLHVEYGGDSEYIVRKVPMERCVVCHNEDRITTFNFKPLTYGGAH
jgi:formate-dependent nitrite reductase cytochrome c552 subunit